MSFISAILINKETTNRIGRTTNNDDVILATDRNAKKDGGFYYSLRVSLSADILRKARFIRGDKMDVLFDFESSPKRMLVVRSASNGWALTFPNQGARARGVIKLVHRDMYPSFKQAVGCEGVITAEGILIDIPNQAVFGRNAREA